MNFNIEIKVLDSNIKSKFFFPNYATPGSSGLDLRACISENKSLLPNNTILVPTGIAIHIKDPFISALILPRSGLGHKNGIVLGNLIGLIDSDFNGQIMLSMWNRSNKIFMITVGMRIAQIVFIPIIRPNFHFVKDFTVNNTERKGKGFGHSGLD